MAGKRKIEALLFDLGGVIVEIDFNRAFTHWAALSHQTPDTIATKFTMDEPYERHERGEIEAAMYFEHLRNTLQLTGSDAQIANGWNDIFVAEISETVAAIKQINNRLPCYAFTNSNATHQVVWESKFSSAMSVFKQTFVSSEMGLRKPELAAFEAISVQTGVDLAATLFFDDTLENIEGALAAGLQAVHVRTSEDVLESLVNVQ